LTFDFSTPSPGLGLRPIARPPFGHPRPCRRPNAPDGLAPLGQTFQLSLLL
jgi:hypothetical protein